MLSVSIFIVAAIPEVAPPAMRKQPDAFVVSITVLAVLCVTAWGALRWKLLRQRRKELSEDPREGRTAKRWQTAQLISFALSEAVALYGVNLRYAGLSLHQVIHFYLAGFLLMVFSFPKAPGSLIDA